jgi:ankyrin repeat protein
MSLIDAVRRGDLAGAAEFIRAGAAVNGLAPDSLTPLMIAAGRGQAQMVELLLFAGADVHAIEPRAGAAAIHKAALSGNPDVVELLLKHGAFIDQQTPVVGHTALMEAIIYKNEDVVRLLLQRGARTSIRNHWQETALDIARRDGLDAIAALIEAREAADRKAVQAHALAVAARDGDVKEVERLIAAGADVNERVRMTGSVDDDYTPLAIAAREGHAAIVRALLDAGANPRRIIGLYFGTALHEACYFGHAGVVGLMTGDRLLPAQRPELDLQGAYNGFTALHDAVWHGHVDAARALVGAGHPLHLRNHAGLTARELAQRYGYRELAQLLLEAEQPAGEEAEARDRG